MSEIDSERRQEIDKLQQKIRSLENEVDMYRERESNNAVSDIVASISNGNNTFRMKSMNYKNS